MSSEIAVRVSRLSKCYQIYGKPQDRLKQSLWRGKRRFFREFWALRDVSFEVKKGEMVGIIGRNGSGKSTLLQIICGTLAPTAGEVETKGRVAALLELGAGFNPEFTGRENVYMNGSILGLPRDEIDARYDEIAGFADIGDFIDQPVKTYSSGMFVRLAFAVQACVEPDILVVDEALAVGDVFFRQKCYKRLAALRERGCSIILVTHAMNDVEQFCERALLLDHGEALFSGAATEAVKRYYLVEQDSRGQGASTRAEPNRSVDSSQAIPAAGSAYLWPAPESFPEISGVPQVGNGWARCTGVAVCDPDGRPCRCFRQGETASFFYEFEVLRDIEVPIGGVVIQSDKGVIVHGRHSLQYGTAMPLHVVRGSRLRFRQDITLDIAVGEYTLEVGLATIGREEYERPARLSDAEFHEKVTRLCHLPGVAHFAVAAARPGELGQPPFYGITNLPGSCQLAVEPAMGAV